MERRKLRCSLRARNRTSRSVEWPHGRRLPEQSGQVKPPAHSVDSTTAGSVPTMITAELASSGRAPLRRDPAKDSARGLFRVQIASTLARHTLPGQTQPLPVMPVERVGARVTITPCSRPVAPHASVVVNQSGAQHFDWKAWALTVPYESAGQYAPLYPDFLIVREDGERPHRGGSPRPPQHRTSRCSRQGCRSGAVYAAKHAPDFGRIELIIVKDKQFRRLDLKDETIRATWPPSRPLPPPAALRRRRMRAGRVRDAHLLAGKQEENRHVNGPRPLDDHATGSPPATPLSSSSGLGIRL